MRWQATSARSAVGIGEGEQFVESRFRIRAAQLDQLVQIVGLEHHEAQEIVGARLARAEAAGQEAKPSR